MLYYVQKLRYRNRKGGYMKENKFKGWCAAHNVKIKDIAELLGIKYNNASAKINGKQNFTLPQVKIICRHYQISADIFLD